MSFDLFLSTVFATFLGATPVTPVVEPDRSSQCLAYNMYHEARGQGTAGIYAVSAVVLNRVNDHRFPNTVCEVVEQGPTRESWKTKKHKDLDPEERVYYPIKNKCQFSWFCDGKSDTPKNKMSWNISLLIANAMLKNKVKDFLHGSTHYHRIDVDPYWNKRMLKFSTIGDHIFYIDALNR